MLTARGETNNELDIGVEAQRCTWFVKLLIDEGSG